MASARQVIDIPLNAGLNTKADPRAMPAPGLAVANDVEFDEAGGLQTRPQFQPVLDSASNTIGEIRRLATYEDELLAFTKDKLWSYSAQDGLWIDKGDYLATKIEEEARFVTTGDQYDCDRAELNGVTFYVWSEDTPSGSNSYIAAIDTETGAVKLAPELILAGGTALRPRLIATKSRVCCVYHKLAPERLVTRSFLVSDMTETGGGYILTGLRGFDLELDPAKPEDFVCVATEATSYEFLRSTAGAALTAITFGSLIDKAPCGITYEPASGKFCVARCQGNTIIADFVTAAGVFGPAGIAVATSLSVTVDQLDCVAHDSGEVRIIWSSGENIAAAPFSIETATVQNTGAASAASVVVHRLGLASRAFLHDGSVFFWCVFAGVSFGDIVAQLQSTYFLMRSDGAIIAKAVPSQAGGFAPTNGHIAQPQHSGDGEYSWPGTLRRIIPLGQGQRGYAAKSPQNTSVRFDSNDARRCEQLGKTLYICGGFLSQYDGRSIAEVGFHLFPWTLGVFPVAGATLSGTYNWKHTYSWQNAKGESERSTTATTSKQPLLTQKAEFSWVNLSVTAKTGVSGEVAVEIWRQVADAPFGATFFLTTSKDPASTGDNAYLENNPSSSSFVTTFDNLSDSDLISREPDPENGGLTLESLPPPPASIIAVTQDRVFLSGIPGNPDRVVYSRLRAQGEVASFHDGLFVDLPADGGPITAIGMIGENLVGFKESAIYALPGEGLNNNGQGQNYGPGRVLTDDVGAVNQESLALTPGGIIFKSAKGWYILTTGWQAKYIGAPVAEFDGESVRSVLVMEAQHQVRILTSARTLVFDYLEGQWAEWGISGAHAILYAGTHNVVNSSEDGLVAQAVTHSGVGDLPRLDIETGWIKLGAFQGYKLIRRVLILGEILGTCGIRVRVAYDYDNTWVDDKAKDEVMSTPGLTLQLQHGPSRPKCQAIKIRITAQESAASQAAPAVSAFNLTALSLEVGLKQGSYRGLGQGQKQ